MNNEEQQKIDQAICRRVLESLPRAPEYRLAVGDVIPDLNTNPFGQTVMAKGTVEQKHVDAVELFSKNNPHQIGPAGHVNFRVEPSNPV